MENISYYTIAETASQEQITLTEDSVIISSHYHRESDHDVWRPVNLRERVSAKD